MELTEVFIFTVSRNCHPHGGSPGDSGEATASVTVRLTGEAFTLTPNRGGRLNPRGRVTVGDGGCHRVPVYEQRELTCISPSLSLFSSEINLRRSRGRPHKSRPSPSGRPALLGVWPRLSLTPSVPADL